MVQVNISKRLVKQTIIGAVYLLIFSALLAPFFAGRLFSKNNNNKNELSALPLKVDLAKLVAFNKDNYNLVFRVINQNSNLAAQNLEIEVSLFDKNDRLVFSKKRRGFVLPSQGRYFVDTGWRLDISKIKRISISIDSVDWVKTNLDFAGLLKVTALEVKKDEMTNSFYLEGILRNDSPYTLREIEVVSLLRDENGDIKGVSKTALFDVLAKSDNYFKISWPAFFYKKYRSLIKTPNFEVYAYSNFLKYSAESKHLNE